MSLLQMKTGQSCRLQEINKSSSCYDRLLELGFTKGEEITLLRKAPLGGPLQVEIRGASYAIRRDEAAHIHVI